MFTKKIYRIISLLLLINLSVLVFAASQTTQTPNDQLLAAVKAGNTTLVNALLAPRANPNATDKQGMPVLLSATIGGNIDIVKALVANGANINSQNTAGYTALMFAIRDNNPEIAQFLLASGADVNIKNNMGWNALMFAADQNQPDIAQLLINKMTTPAPNTTNNTNTSNTIDAAFVWAVSKGNTNVAEVLANTGQVNINSVNPATNPNHVTPLMRAAIKNNTDLIQFLLDKGADINATDTQNRTALMWAAQMGNIAAVQKLLTVKNINIPTDISSYKPAIQKALKNSLPQNTPDSTQLSQAT